MLVLLGLIMIAVGIVRLAWPGVARSMDRFSNEWDGVQTKQGGTYEVGRMVSGVALIIAGFVVLIGP